LTAPTRAFIDRVYRPSCTDLEMIEHANGDWRYRVGVWHGRFAAPDARDPDRRDAAMVKIVDWPATGKQGPATLMTLIWGHQLQRRWPHNFTNRKLAQLAREFCEDAQRGAVGLQ